MADSFPALVMNHLKSKYSNKNGITLSLVRVHGCLLPNSTVDFSDHERLFGSPYNDYENNKQTLLLLTTKDK